VSYSSHRRAALDAESPLAHRVSHVRSCARLVATKLRVPREDIAARVKATNGIDLSALTTGEAIEAAIAAIDAFRARD
jgi:hypothetical protein